MTARGSAHSEGFTLMEVLVATFILVFAVASAAAVLVAAMTQGNASRRATEAAAMAQGELETLRDQRYEDLASASPQTRVVGANTYTLLRTVTENDPAPNMKRIRLTVSWTARGANTYVVETIYTNLRE